MSFISPQPKEGQDYLLDFLPVVENPFLYEKFELTKVKSLYVVRLRILRAPNREEFICNIDLKTGKIRENGRSKNKKVMESRGRFLFNRGFI